MDFKTTHQVLKKIEVKNLKKKMQLQKPKNNVNTITTNTNYYLIGEEKIRKGLDFDEQGNQEMGFFSLFLRET
jgi:hypothetical protein